MGCVFKNANCFESCRLLLGVAINAGTGAPRWVPKRGRRAWAESCSQWIGGCADGDWTGAAGEFRPADTKLHSHTEHRSWFRTEACVDRKDRGIIR